jgi:hypothetical protein
MPRFVRFKSKATMRLADSFNYAEDYDSVVLVPGIEYTGNFFFCLNGELHAAPINSDDTVAFEEATLVESYESEEDYKMLKEIARKLRCRLAI